MMKLKGCCLIHSSLTAPLRSLGLTLRLISAPHCVSSGAGLLGWRIHLLIPQALPVLCHRGVKRRILRHTAPTAPPPLHCVSSASPGCCCLGDAESWRRNWGDRSKSFPPPPSSFSALSHSSHPLIELSRRLAWNRCSETGREGGRAGRGNGRKGEGEEEGWDRSSILFPHSSSVTTSSISARMQSHSYRIWVVWLGRIG